MEKCMEICNKMDVPKYMPKKQKIKTEENDDVVEGGIDDDKIIESCFTYLNGLEMDKSHKV
jgi:hypothetical protein